MTRHLPPNITRIIVGALVCAFISTSISWAQPTHNLLAPVRGAERIGAADGGVEIYYDRDTEALSVFPGFGVPLLGDETNQALILLLNYGFSFPLVTVGYSHSAVPSDFCHRHMPQGIGPEAMHELYGFIRYLTDADNEEYRALERELKDLEGVDVKEIPFQIERLPTQAKVNSYEGGGDMPPTQEMVRNIGGNTQWKILVVEAPHTVLEEAKDTGDWREFERIIKERWRAVDKVVKKYVLLSDKVIEVSSDGMEAKRQAYLASSIAAAGELPDEAIEAAAMAEAARRLRRRILSSIERKGLISSEQAVENGYSWVIKERSRTMDKVSTADVELQLALETELLEKAIYDCVMGTVIRRTNEVRDITDWYVGEGRPGFDAVPIFEERARYCILVTMDPQFLKDHNPETSFEFKAYHGGPKGYEVTYEGPISIADEVEYILVPNYIWGEAREAFAAHRDKLVCVEGTRRVNMIHSSSKASSPQEVPDFSSAIRELYEGTADVRHLGIHGVRLPTASDFERNPQVELQQRIYERFRDHDRIEYIEALRAIRELSTTEDDLLPTLKWMGFVGSIGDGRRLRLDEDNLEEDRPELLRSLSTYESMQRLLEEVRAAISTPAASEQLVPTPTPPRTKSSL